MIFRERMSDLSILANNLKAHPNSSIQVIGDTDSTGNASINQVLSLERAETIKRDLLKSAISTNRSISIGRAEI